jgi:GTP-binding protein
MIVSDVPGTTRDAIDTLFERDGRPDIIFTDTAGIRRKSRVKSRIEKFSVIKALDAMRDSHITLVLLDATEGITDQDKRIIGFAAEHGKACITLFNKWDLVKDDKRAVKLRLNELERAKNFIRYAPHLNISALTGKNINRILPIADQVFDDFTRQANTGLLNRILERAVRRRNPPMSKGHHIKLYYTTQVAICPPTFVIFANYPEYIPEHYRRFLSNVFREELGISLSPVKIIFRQRERRK